MPAHYSNTGFLDCLPLTYNHTDRQVYLNWENIILAVWPCMCYLISLGLSFVVRTMEIILGCGTFVMMSEIPLCCAILGSVTITLINNPCRSPVRQPQLFCSYRFCFLTLSWYILDPCLSTFGLKTRSIGITWELVRNADLRPHSRSPESGSAF